MKTKINKKWRNNVGMDKTTHYLAVQEGQSCSALAPVFSHNGQHLQPMSVHSLATTVMEQSRGDSIPHVHAGVHLDDVLIGILRKGIEVI
jgi:hypothetical protein